MSYRTNCHSGDAADTLELRSNQIATLNKFKQSLLTLNLAAMDAIVDKAQGSVSADVMNEIREAATYLRNSLGGLRELADHPDEQQFVADIERGIQEFLPVVEQQLVAAIRAQDGDEVFAALDDEIDGSLTVIMEKFDLLLQDVENEALEATEELHGVLDTANGILITIILVVLALLTPAGYLFASGIVGPLRRGQEMITELEAGHLDRRLNLTNQDEMGDMARSMDAFADSLQREVVENLQLLAAGDLCFDVTPRDDKDMLRSSVKKVSDDLQELLVQIQQACHQIATGSNEVSDSSQSLSQGATQSASSLEEIAASMTEMASQTKLNADNAEQANQLSIESKKSC